MELQAPDQTTIPALFSAGNKPIDRLWVYTTRGTKVETPRAASSNSGGATIVMPNILF